MVESNWIWYEQFKTQLLIVHWVFVDNESLQFNWIIETISRTWLRRNWIGDDKFDVPGISVIVGGKHAEMREI